ncbi:hypothetical protein ABGB12_01045 [Actinocorallia sp. B10E7]|uniref:hypothetical protein n=1 Tax=Actinocorallia sp. B10E7 TaxID=3153558 RepID=UPI00325CF056
MTVDELFDSPPPQWGTRGDPHAWKALRRHLAGVSVPAEAGELEKLLVEGFLAVVGADLRVADDEYVYRQEFAHGGMSSGQVHLPTWRARLIPLLVSRGAPNRTG